MKKNFARLFGLNALGFGIIFSVLSGCSGPIPLSEVIQPEQAIAERLSKRLTLNNVSDMFDFKGSTIAEVKVPPSLSGKSIRELDIRQKHNISLLLLKKPGKEVENIWNPDIILEEGDELTIIGDEKSIIKVFQK